MVPCCVLLLIELLCRWLSCSRYLRGFVCPAGVLPTGNGSNSTLCMLDDEKKVRSLGVNIFRKDSFSSPCPCACCYHDHQLSCTSSWWRPPGRETAGPRSGRWTTSSKPPGTRAGSTSSGETDRMKLAPIEYVQTQPRFFGPRYDHKSLPTTTLTSPARPKLSSALNPKPATQPLSHIIADIP